MLVGAKSQREDAEEPTAAHGMASDQGRVYSGCLSHGSLGFLGEESRRCFDDVVGSRGGQFGCRSGALTEIR